MTDALADPVLQREFEHEQLHVVHDARSGLTAVVAIHSTVRGPAAGGVRLSRYASLDAATEDALRLTRAMTLKSSAAGLEHAGPGRRFRAVAARRGHAGRGRGDRGGMSDFAGAC